MTCAADHVAGWRGASVTLYVDQFGRRPGGRNDQLFKSASLSPLGYRRPEIKWFRNSMVYLRIIDLAENNIVRLENFLHP